MTDEYILNYRSYGGTNYPLAFFSYIAGTFGVNIDSQLQAITNETGISGSAMPIDILIDFAEDYELKKRTHEDVFRIFGIGREVKLADIA
ncbi:MAG: hypothetical protein IKF60_06275 [Solobacterium sp.]|nr:hypothetical protein [Solobacterium sp.]